MRLSKVPLAFIFSAVLAATTLASKVYTDYDPNANFSQYKSFMWIKTPHMAVPLMSERIVNAINSELAAKGWQLVTEGADVAIAAHVATKKERTLETFYSGFGGGWGWRWVGRHRFRRALRRPEEDRQKAE